MFYKMYITQTYILKKLKFYLTFKCIFFKSFRAIQVIKESIEMYKRQVCFLKKNLIRVTSSFAV